MQNRFFDRTVALLDRIAPETSRKSREDLRRSRSVVAASLLGCIFLTTTGISTLLLGMDRGLPLLNFALSAAIIAVLFISRWLSSDSLLSNALVTLGFGHTLLLSALSGGRNIGALFGFSVFPLIAVLLAGWRSGLVFTALSAAAVVFTPLVPVDWLTPSYLGRAPVELTLVRDALNVIFAVGLLAALYDAVRGATLRDTEDALRIAEESSVRAQLVADRQRQLIELSRRLQETTLESFDAELESAMELAARLAGVDRTILRLIDGRSYLSRYAYGEGDGPPEIGYQDAGRAGEAFSWVRDRIIAGQVVQTRNIELLPSEAEAERAYLKSRGVVSWLCVPIRAGRTNAGFQSFETTSEEKTWSEEETASLRLMTQLLAAAVLRHRTALALSESEKKFADAFRDHPDAMIIIDLQTYEILECNEQWLVEAGVATRAEVLGRRLVDFGFQFADDQLEGITRVLLDSGRTPAVEFRVIGRGGEPRTYLVSATRIDVAGRVSALCNVHDLTERKLLEQQLLHAQKMEAVGRLAGGIAHDFNNMLTVISGYSAGLMDSLDGEPHRDAREIHEAARRSAELTRQLLAFSRRQVLQTEILDPNELVAGLESMLRPLIGELIELKLSLAANVGSVRSDRSQLEQAIVNLVVNSRDAMPEGGGLKLETRRVDYGEDGASTARPIDLEPGAYVVISVEDDGEGMDPELVEHVMEPFYTTKPEGHGTGLGLPMAHGLARQCGGTLVLDCESGRGTRAQIFLPVIDQPAQAPRSPGDQGARQADSASRTILLAEDEATVRRLAARTLRAAGYEVIEVENGEQAFQRALELGDAVDLVVSDIVMPRLSGIDLTRRLRDQRPGLPVVLMSGYPDAAEDRPVPDDVIFVLKPFEPESLCDAAARALRRKAAQPAVDA